ncbi:MAG: hypothetical protein J2P56_00605 [Verrucomicrobia bacterium]|nr:hypothetical protein [Verrucomicrobiota bacterium]
MKDLASYLNDHLAGSVGALELVEHWAQLHKGNPLGVFFSDIKSEIRADQATLREMMRSLEIEESNLRKAGAWAAEKAGRARLMIAGDEAHSLGLVLTLEGLIMGITGKKLLWLALDAAKLPQLHSYNFQELESRADEQIKRIETERIQAAQEAFTAVKL